LTPFTVKSDPMTIAEGLAALFSRDLARLIQELEAFPDDQTLWRHAPGVKNSAGNLVLHLEGNLREYIGRQLGRVPYSRARDQEFALNGLGREELVGRMKQVRELVAKVVSELSDAQLAATYPEQVLETTISSHDFLVHLHGHLNFHLGQIDYLRRILTEGSAVAFAGL
jgi:DinB superfamily